MSQLFGFTVEEVCYVLLSSLQFVVMQIWRMLVLFSSIFLSFSVISFPVESIVLACCSLNEDAIDVLN